MLENHKIWSTPGGMEGGGEKGRRSLDMAPVAPHTVDWQVRDCKSCHTQPEELGYGIHEGRYLRGDAEGIYAGIMNEKGELVPNADAEHMKRIGKSMFIAANLQIFGPLVGVIVVLLFVMICKTRKSA